METSNYKDPVSVTCYGKTKVWERKEAISFFLEGMHWCDGAERDRYTEIYLQLIDGAKEASDEYYGTV